VVIVKVSLHLPTFIIPHFWTYSGPVSSVVITTGYGLDGPGNGSRWGAKFSAPVQTGPGAQPASCTMGTGSFPGVQNGRGVTMTPHPLLVSWPRKDRTTPLLPLWAVRPVQSLSACTMVHFTLPTFTWNYSDQCTHVIFCLSYTCQCLIESNPGPCDLRHSSAAARLLWLRVRILPRALIFVSCVCSVLCT